MAVPVKVRIRNEGAGTDERYYGQYAYEGNAHHISFETDSGAHVFRIGTREAVISRPGTIAPQVRVVLGTHCPLKVGTPYGTLALSVRGESIRIRGTGADRTFTLTYALYQGDAFADRVTVVVSARTYEEGTPGDFPDSHFACHMA